MCQNVGKPDQQKAGKQDRDDNINCSVDNPTLHISIKCGKICRAGVYTCTEQFYIILLVSLLFADLLLLHLVTFIVFKLLSERFIHSVGKTQSSLASSILHTMVSYTIFYSKQCRAHHFTASK